MDGRSRRAFTAIKCFCKASKLLVVHSFYILNKEPRRMFLSQGYLSRIQARGICSTLSRAISALYDSVGNAFLKDTDSLQYPSLATVFAMESIAVHSRQGCMCSVLQCIERTNMYSCRDKRHKFVVYTLADCFCIFGEQSF